MFRKLGKLIITLPRWGARIILLLIIIPFILGFFAVCQQQSTEPSVKNAPWAVQTYTYMDDGTKVRSRLFYGQQYSTVDGTPTLLNWYEWNGKKYILHKETTSFPQSEWGAVDIIKRPGQ
ncbi:MAG: hypothetical protein PHG35_02040 [Dehalococcoidales bacterium]|nr:hypothetical protein [Dehalococcoidales bacterium]